MADGDGEVAVDAEVEPLHGIAERGRLDGPLHRCLVGDGDVRAPQRRILPAFHRAKEGPVAFDRRGVGGGPGLLWVDDARHGVIPSVDAKFQGITCSKVAAANGSPL